MRSLSEKLAFISGIATGMIVFLSILLIVFCNLSVYFVTRRHEKQINCEQDNLVLSTGLIM